MLNQRRHLAAILFTDIVGYTAMMQKDEALAVSIMRRYHDVLKKTIESYSGEILNDYGDGSLCSFVSATEAVKASLNLQYQFQKKLVIPVRIGLHIGEIFFEEGKVMGDGVNIASRIQSLGQSNTILFSAEINNKIKNNPEFRSISLGSFEFKNVDEPVEIFALANEGLTIPKKAGMSGKLKDSKKNILRKQLLTAGFICILLAGFFIYKIFYGKKEIDNKEKTIAILPFKNISVSKEENEPFCVGVVMELQKKLEWLSGLTPIAAQSVEKYRDTKVSLPEISRQLGGVRYIVQGTVQRDKNKIKVFASLVDAINGKVLWSDDFPGEIEDVFTLQENIAEQIAAALRVKITPEEKKYISRVSTKNIKALDIYNEALNVYVTLAYSFHSTWAEEISSNPGVYAAYLKTLTLCNRAIELDSNMA